jgi:hypothetical protein
VANGCIKFILSCQEEQGWRYLPELPLDVDDTAMAMISFQRAGAKVPDRLVLSLAAQQLATGGFRTFFDSETDTEHFAVTVNAVYALWNEDRKTAERGLNYLMRWLEESRWDELQWMYSPLLPMYLLARGNKALGENAAAIQARVAEVVLTLRREDGLWGNGNPECVETALAVLALHECSVRPTGIPAVIDHLRASQCRDGTWPWAPVFSDGDGQWFGHRALSTVLCCAVFSLERLVDLADDALAKTGVFRS